MRKIVCIMAPFDAKQKLDIVEDHEVVDTFTLDTFTFISTLPEKAKEYSINEVAFAGADAPGPADAAVTSGCRPSQSARYGDAETGC